MRLFNLFIMLGFLSSGICLAQVQQGVEANYRLEVPNYPALPTLTPAMDPLTADYVIAGEEASARAYAARIMGVENVNMLATQYAEDRQDYRTQRQWNREDAAAARQNNAQLTRQFMNTPEFRAMAYQQFMANKSAQFRSGNINRERMEKLEQRQYCLVELQQTGPIGLSPECENVLGYLTIEALDNCSSEQCAAVKARQQQELAGFDNMAAAFVMGNAN